MSYRTIRRLAGATALAGASLWLGALAFSFAYYGDSLSVTFGDGCVAVFWGGDDAISRNSFIINGFTWPGFSTGAGTQWSADRWGRWSADGPQTLLSSGCLKNRLEYPQLFGFYTPGLSFRVPLDHIGFPFWTITAAGLIVWLALTPRRKPIGHCPSCAYDLTGNTTGICPECGHAVGALSASEGRNPEPGSLSRV